MSQQTHELVEELQRLKPGSPILHHFRDVAEGIEWWNSLYRTEREYWLKRAKPNGDASAADAWRAYKLARAGDAIVAAYAREFGRSLFER